MPLSPEESRCVQLTCRYLDSIFGPSWNAAAGPTLDDQNPSTPSPETLVGNGQVTAAIEVKGLSGPHFRQYAASLFDLRDFLLPSYGGHYFLHPPTDFRLPARRPLKQRLQAEIERVAVGMLPGQTAAVQILRRGQISVISAKGPGVIFCDHGQFPEMGRASQKVSSAYRLDEAEEFDHRFMTDPARQFFVEALVDACARCSPAPAVPVEWYEEWPLIRDQSQPDGVTVVGVTKAWDGVGVIESMIDLAEKKFAHKRWGDLHILVFHDAPREDLVEAVTSGVSEWGSGIDLILVAATDKVRPVWTKPTRIGKDLQC